MNDYVKLKAALKMAAKLLKKKIKGKHPSKKEMITFTTRFRLWLDVRLVGKFDPENPFTGFSENESYFPSYFQYLELRLRAYGISSSCIILSTLPWRDILDALGITPICLHAMNCMQKYHLLMDYPNERYGPLFNEEGGPYSIWYDYNSISKH